MQTYRPRMLILAAMTTLLLTGCWSQSNQNVETHRLANSQVSSLRSGPEAGAATLDGLLEQFGKAYHTLKHKTDDICKLFRRLSPGAIKNDTFRLEFERVREDLMKAIERFEKLPDSDKMEEVITKHLKLFFEKHLGNRT